MIHSLEEKPIEIPKPNLKTIPFILIFLLQGFFEYFLRARKVSPDPVEIKANELKIWMVGHASTLINFFGTTILTDPVFERALPFPARLIKPGLNMDQLPSIDLVLVSHAHMDHFSKPSLKKLSARTDTIIIPKNCSSLLKKTNFKNVIELDWEQETQSKGIAIKAFRPIHWGDRYPWQASLKRGYNSYILQKNNKTVFFCGDSAYGKFFQRLGSTYKIDMALLPISAYKPHPFRAVHMNPEDAMHAWLDLGAKHVVPIHWGNFRLSFEPIGEPKEWIKRLAKKANLTDRLHVLENGKSWRLPFDRQTNQN